MLDLKKSINFPYLNWKYFLPILLFSFLSLINDMFFLVTLLLVIFFGIGLFGTKIIDRLKSYNKSYKYILKFTAVVFLVTIIFLIMQFIVIFLGSLPMLFLSFDFILSNLSDSFLGSLSIGVVFGIIFFVIFLLFAIVLEFLKIMGLINYFRSNKFEDIFTIKENFKKIFSKDFFVVLFFLIGFSLMYFILFILLGSLIDNLIIKLFGFSIFYVFFILYFFIVIGTLYSAMNELIINKKNK